MAMNVTASNETLIYLVLVLFIIIGLKFITWPKYALLGNRLAAVGMALAIATVLAIYNVFDPVLVYTSLIIGSLIGIWLANVVKMAQMPQVVSVFNGLGAGAAIIIPLIEIINSGLEVDLFTKSTSILGIIVGGLAFSGSMLAATKLHGLVRTRPIIFPKHTLIMFGMAALLVIIGFFAVQLPNELFIWNLVIVLGVALVFGLVFALRVGGADMPVAITFLCGLHGLADALVGFVVQNLMLIAIGAIIASSGTILTRIMCRAMNRTLWGVLTGKTVETTAKEAVTVQVAARSLIEKKIKDPLSEAAMALKDSKTVIIVPGYGMAVAQAQKYVKELSDLLEKKGANVKFAVHPVAGRMPGHMNVLLAEVDVNYEKLYDMDSINPEFQHTDVAFVVGACDIVNPAAISAKGTPIYGMPILKAHEAKRIIVCNLDDRPGYSGVDNILYKNEKVILVLGNAAETIPKITNILKNMIA